MTLKLAFETVLLQYENTKDSDQLFEDLQTIFWDKDVIIDVILSNGWEGDFR